ncbi:MAG: hypothetical protein H0T78_08615 [Longispora sp.]|nr:hypothetical protein [Longispora sp. (in: high G+C Gram-positive bacteria)]
MPLADTNRPEGMRWAAATNIGFAMPGGYFLGPAGGVDGQPGRLDAPPSRTSGLLNEVVASGQPVVPTEELRAAVRDDLLRWNAGIIVLPVDQLNAGPLRTTLDGLVGPSAQVNDVWMWDVRTI